MPSEPTFQELLSEGTHEAVVASLAQSRAKRADKARRETAERAAAAERAERERVEKVRSNLLTALADIRRSAEQRQRVRADERARALRKEFETEQVAQHRAYVEAEAERTRESELQRIREEEAVKAQAWAAADVHRVTVNLHEGGAVEAVEPNEAAQ